jgi:hypothetical protein
MGESTMVRNSSSVCSIDLSCLVTWGDFVAVVGYIVEGVFIGLGDQDGVAMSMVWNSSSEYSMDMFIVWKCYSSEISMDCSKHACVVDRSRSISANSATLTFRS